MVFQELTNRFVAPEYSIYKTQMQYGTTENGQFKGIEYLLFESPNEERIWQVIPEPHRQDFFMSIMRVNTEIPPHTDSGIQTTINFYIRTDNCRTQYYRLKTSQPKITQVDNQTDGHIFDPDDLEETESFVASAGSAWLLDVSKPHAVIPQGKFTKRLAIALSSKLAYNQVADILRTTGNL
jgi:hypothetical protein